MTVGEVAQVVGVPRETLRTWLRNPAFEDIRVTAQEGGWRRFTDFEVINIGVYGKLIECTADHEAATVGMLLAAKMLIDEWQKVDGVPYLADETFRRDRVMFFWRKQDGTWDAEICDMDQSFTSAIHARIDATYEEGPSFHFINIGTILKRVFMSLLKVQIEMDGGK